MMPCLPRGVWVSIRRLTADLSLSQGAGDGDASNEARRESPMIRFGPWMR